MDLAARLSTLGPPKMLYWPTIRPVLLTALADVGAQLPNSSTRRKQLAFTAVLNPEALTLILRGALHP